MVSSQIKWTTSSLTLFIVIVLHPLNALSDDVTYDDLVALNAACGNLDSCRGTRTTDDLRVVNCQCGPGCAVLDTCCVDSKYRKLTAVNRNKLISPIKIYRNIEVVFMVNQCRPDWQGDSAIKDLCGMDVLRAFHNDVFLSMPVTNLRNGITYKNYYCFACNEEDSSDSPVLWQMNLYHATNLSLGSVRAVTYNEEKGDYYAVGKEYEWTYATVGVPEKISDRVTYYRQNVVSTCDEKWTDIETKEKCESYTALVHSMKMSWLEPMYKNPHCAICNYEKVSDLLCSPKEKKTIGGGPPYGFLLSGIFSFEDKIKRCARFKVFDTYSKKCRGFKCGRNQKLVDGKCEGSVGPLRARPGNSGAIRSPIASTGLQKRY